MRPGSDILRKSLRNRKFQLEIFLLHVYWLYGHIRQLSKRKGLAEFEPALTLRRVAKTIK